MLIHVEGIILHYKLSLFHRNILIGGNVAPDVQREGRDLNYELCAVQSCYPNLYAAF